MTAKSREPREWRQNWIYPAALALHLLGTPLAFIVVMTAGGIIAAFVARAPNWVPASVLAVGLAFLILAWIARSRSRVVRSIERLSTQIGIGAFGGAPAISQSALRQLPPDRRSDFALVAERPEAPLAVALRTIFDRLTRAFGPGGQVVAVSTVRAAADHSNFALLLAATAASAGRRVIVVDGDLHNRAVSHALSLADSEGVWDVVKNGKSWRSASTFVDHLNLTVLPAGTEERAVRETYADGGFSSLLKELRANFDVVIVDTPGALQGPDARMTAALADVAVLVASWGRTTVLEARRAVHALCDRAPHVRVGVAVIGVRQRDGKASWMQLFSGA